jgi:hypothetical protein
MAPEPIPIAERRDALERILASRTFSRSEQLRAFLRYICEAEFEGRAQQLNEYALGVSVLGRPAGYSPAEDSCVRTRAYELRGKLRTYFGSEAPGEPIQIEIDKGAYVPRFVRRAAAVADLPLPAPAPAAATTATTTPAIDPGVPAPGPSPSPPPARPPRRMGVPAGVALALGVAAVAAAVSWSWLGRNRPPPAAAGPLGPNATREMEALWGPFVQSGAPLLISFDTRLFFFAPATGLVVRDYLTNQPAEATRSKALQAFQDRMGARELDERFDYADFGAVHAAFLLGRLLGRDVGLKHSNLLGWQDIWNSNIIFIGKPSLNPTIRYALQGQDFVETEFGNGIRNLHPLPGEPELYRSAETHGAGEKYALITILPGPQPGRRMMILSGAGAELMWALAEAVTAPARVKEIMSHVLTPAGDCPSAFQVVISAAFESNVPIKIGYVTHRVSKAP